MILYKYEQQLYSTFLLHYSVIASSKEPSSTHKARLVSVLISLGATYVIGDMYSANLTSLLARPARERPIGTLPALEEAMRDHGYELVVESHSSSFAILEVSLNKEHIEREF